MSIAIFLWGSSYDLMVNFGISHPESMKSVWFVVEVVNQVEEFCIHFPMDTDKQQKLPMNLLPLVALDFLIVLVVLMAYSSG